MSDRELLELAAKAAGIASIDNYIPHPGWAPRAWNPLNSDGDALRLAVKLKMFDMQAIGSFRVDLCCDDPYSATRRAIVRTAAEIGKYINDTKTKRI